MAETLETRSLPELKGHLEKPVDPQQKRANASFRRMLFALSLLIALAVTNFGFGSLNPSWELLPFLKYIRCSFPFLFFLAFLFGPRSKTKLIGLSVTGTSCAFILLGELIGSPGYYRSYWGDLPIQSLHAGDCTVSIYRFIEHKTTGLSVVCDKGLILGLQKRRELARIHPALNGTVKSIGANKILFQADQWDGKKYEKVLTLEDGAASHR